MCSFDESQIVVLVYTTHLLCAVYVGDMYEGFFSKWELKHELLFRSE